MNQEFEDQEAQAITGLVDAMLADPGLAGSEHARADQAGPDPSGANRTQALRELRVAQALRAEGPAPSLSLLSAVERQVRAAPGEGQARAPRRSWLFRPAFAAAAAGAVVVVAIVGALQLGGSQDHPGRGFGPHHLGPLGDAARLAFAPAASGAPGATSSTLLDVAYHGVTFPNYSHQFGSSPTGERTDTIAGEGVLTVFYRLHDGVRLSYSVFSGSPVPVPSNAATTRFDGVTLQAFTTPYGLSVVTLVRHGRTCVLASSGASVGKLLQLAEWPLTVSHV